jgi:aspartate/methionine/tyrosine aminotransferase
MIVANRLNGIGEYYFSQKLREIDGMNKAGHMVINLGIGSPDLPPHPEVIEILQRESAKPGVHAYQSYKGAPVLRQAMAHWYQKWYGVSLNPETEILPLIGSKEGIMHICMTYLNEGDEVLVPNPGYPTYRSAVKLAGGTCVDYTLTEENDWQPDLEALEKSDLSKVKMMWVNYPQMPTGQLPAQAVFEQLVAFAQKHNILLCHDNPYSFILNDKPASILATKGAMDVALELNSLSKSHNMAGWRVGMLSGHAQRIEEVLRFKSNMDSGMYLPVQLAAARALQLDEAWHQQLNDIYTKRRELAFQLLAQTGCSINKNQVGMFVWARIPQGYQNGFEFSDHYLQQAKVFLTPGGIFGSAGNGFTRISLCSPEEKIQEAINRINALA